MCDNVYEIYYREIKNDFAENATDWTESINDDNGTYFGLIAETTRAMAIRTAIEQMARKNMNVEMLEIDAVKFEDRMYILTDIDYYENVICSKSLDDCKNHFDADYESGKLHITLMARNEINGDTYPAQDRNGRSEEYVFENGEWVEI